jgi:hypothetical protein
VRVVIDVVSVMAVYFDLLCMRIVQRAEGYCLLHGEKYARTRGQNMPP